MLKACKYCGRIHDRKFDCGKRPQRRKENTEVDKFRWSKVWQRKREEIRERDHNLCQACIRGLCGTERTFNYEDLSVHHAVPAAVDWDKRLDNDNLITLCSMHHEMAEAGQIPYGQIKKIIDEQERAYEEEHDLD